MASDSKAPSGGSHGGETRRDFLQLTAAAFGAVGTGIAAWPLVNSLNPAKDTLSLSSTEVDIAPIRVGQSITVMWRGKPVFIRHRTQEEIAAAQAVPAQDLRDPQADSERVQRPEWLILVGICTHLGCIPQGQKASDDRGEYGGWFCPCHGSAYDTSGRIRKGPPSIWPCRPDAFLSDTLVKIG